MVGRVVCMDFGPVKMGRGRSMAVEEIVKRNLI